MNNDSFEKHVEEHLNGLPIERVCFFAWLCAVRALPLLSVQKHFTYWQSQDRMRYLYYVFNALDQMHMTFGNIRTSSVDDVSARTMARTAANDAYFVASKAENDTVFTAVRAAAAAADTINTSSCAIRAADAADIAFFAARKASLKAIILDDLMIIKECRSDDFNNDITIYGSLWQAFLNDLSAAGCGYWARLYQNLFESSFKIDEKELDRRLNVPKSILDLGAAAVAGYLENMSVHGAKYLNEARIIILGETGAGKTSLARKLLNPSTELPKDDESTEGVDIMQWILDATGGQEAVHAHIWDFAGHYTTHTAHKFFLSERCVYVIVYDGRTERRSDLEYWLDHVRNYGDNSPVFILVNERVDRPISLDENGLMDKYPSIRQFFRVSKGMVDIHIFRDALANFIRTDPAWSGKIPEPWFVLKKALANLFTENHKESISLEEFHDIAQHAGIDTIDTEDARRALNALGICLWYEKIEDLNMLVLNPSWISQGVYRIIHWMQVEKKYQLRINDLSIVFEKELHRYPKDKHNFLFTLLKTYELAYPLMGDLETLVLPLALAESTPERGMEQAFSICDSLMMRFKATCALPPDIIPRFIVRHHGNIAIDLYGEQVVWRHGASLIGDKGSEALVLEDDREIRLLAKGANARIIFSAFRDSLISIFKEYRSDFPALEYVVTETSEHKPVYLESSIMEMLADKGVLYEASKGVTINLTSKIAQLGGIGNIANTGNDNTIRSAISINSSSLPDVITEEQFAKASEMLSDLLNSDAADELTGKQVKELKEKLEEAPNHGFQKGWAILRGFLSDAANVYTVGAAISAYLTAHPEIPQNVMALFGK